MTHNSLSNNSIDKVQGIYHINRKGRYPRGNKNTTPMTGIAPETYCYSYLIKGVKRYYYASSHIRRQLTFV